MLAEDRARVVDTGPLVAYLDPSDADHAWARAVEVVPTTAHDDRKAGRLQIEDFDRGLSLTDGTLVARRPGPAPDQVTSQVPRPGVGRRPHRAARAPVEGGGVAVGKLDGTG